MKTWMFGKLDEETLSRVFILRCHGCDRTIQLGEGYGLKLREHVPWWRFWQKHAKVDSYCMSCINKEILGQIATLSPKTKKVISGGLGKIIEEELQSLHPKVKMVGAFNFAFTLFEDGSAEFKKAINPKEVVYLNKDQVLDVYDDLTKFYQSSKPKVK